MRRIALVIHALHGGGAERVAAAMANMWVTQGDHVSVVTLDTVQSDVYPVDPCVERIGLGVMGTSRGPLQALGNNRDRIRQLRSALEQVRPDGVISLTDRTNIVTLLACRCTGYPVVIAEHSDPRRQHLGFVWERLRNWTYPRATAAVVLTHAVAEYFRQRFPRLPVHVIPNGIDAPADELLAAAGGDSSRVVALGRLSPEKGFDALIDAFAAIAPRHPWWRLEIAGEGPERTRLEQRIDQHGLRGQVSLVGWVDQPARFLAQASIFFLASRYEGFPVSLLEAMATGLAVISTDCETGPREIVRHQVDGLLVPVDNPSLWGPALERLMDDRALRQRLGRSAREVVVRFSSEQFARQWTAVLEEVLRRPLPGEA